MTFAKFSCRNDDKGSCNNELDYFFSTDPVEVIRTPPTLDSVSSTGFKMIENSELVQICVDTSKFSDTYFYIYAQTVQDGTADEAYSAKTNQIRFIVSCGKETVTRTLVENPSISNAFYSSSM